MNWNDHVLLWNQSNIKVLDIRHTLLKFGDELHAYSLPASCFLYATRGGARVMMDGMEYEAKRFHVLHGGKGMCLNIFLTEEAFEYYLIFYKAVLTLPYSRDVQPFMEQNNPFQVQYGFKPQDPICLYHKVQQMDRQWRQSRMLDKLHVKTYMICCDN
ncbi:hypothetical protein [Paenibacillus mendelii]|uniref:AraC family transcriptional regulator n=1 Tax=Paenibacillus mendelii TaxID=206163 RepID=A0ABV6J4H7_9BACL|nr:hypothetical protein [Paenibacillus mendelii]MCQ6561797.1 hypothetical protein [Paenibacillus mendelii]